LTKFHVFEYRFFEKTLNFDPIFRNEKKALCQSSVKGISGIEEAFSGIYGGININAIPSSE